MLLVFSGTIDRDIILSDLVGTLAVNVIHSTIRYAPSVYLIFVEL